MEVLSQFQQLILWLLYFLLFNGQSRQKDAARMFGLGKP